MTRHTLTLLILIALAVAIGGAFRLSTHIVSPTTSLSATSSVSQSSSTPIATTKPQAAAQSAVASKESAAKPFAAPSGPILTITVGSTTYTVPAKNGETVIDAMNDARKEGLTFSGETYAGLGYMILSINGTKADNGYNWMLYINGTQSAAGASAGHASAGDTIEWRYEK